MQLGALVVDANGSDHVIEHYSLWAGVCSLSAHWPRGLAPMPYTVGCDRTY